MEVEGTGEVPRKVIKKIMENLGLHHDNYLKA